MIGPKYSTISWGGKQQILDNLLVFSKGKMFNILTPVYSISLNIAGNQVINFFWRQD